MSGVRCGTDMDKCKQRNERIVARQGGFAWGMAYVPAIKATREEGPRGSRLSQLWSATLGRYVHLLSRAERTFAQLALYNPHLFELHEQRMLSPFTTVHPLHGHPRALGMSLPNLLGTVDILRDGHPVYYRRDDGEIAYAVPDVFVGDLLLFLEYPGGMPYCVNWNIKGDKSDFSEQRRSDLKSLETQRKHRLKATRRQQTEREYYAAAGIRTLELSPECIDLNVRQNLNFLHKWQGHSFEPEAAIADDFDTEVQEAVSTGDRVSEIVVRYASKWGARDQFLGRIFQSIWYRKLQVDLFKPLLIDRPFFPQTRDLLIEYRDLYAEASQ